jgi:asparagine synthase (glutamine-hydrolysing)
MPGIAGFVTSNPDQRAATTTLTRMIDSMVQQEGLRCGSLILPELGCYLGWAMHKDSAATVNPIRSNDGDVVLVFTGEHFSHETRRASGWDTQPLLEGAHDRVPDDLNGWFSGVIVDRKRRTIQLFNDRFGIGRIYYREARDGFFFASQAKALLTVRPETRSLDPTSVGHFLGFGAVFDNRSLFTNVSVLPQGSCWNIEEPSSIRKRAYFLPATWAEQSILEPEPFYRALRDTVAEVVPTYFRSTQPVGLSLTGGLDTRIVMAGMPAGLDPMPAYTYSGAYRDCYDIKIARDIAEACGQRHHVISLGPEFFGNFAALAEDTVWATDGCLDLCGTHEIHFSRQARRLSPVRLTGNYGSEVLRSVSTFKYNPPQRTLFDPTVVNTTRAAAQSFADVRAAHPVTFAAFQEIAWNLFGRLASAQSELTLRAPYLDNAIVALMYRAPAPLRKNNEPSRRLIADLSPRLAAIPTDMGYEPNQRSFSARGFVRRVYRYAQFKAEWYYNLGMPSWLSRLDGSAALKATEPLFLGRHKIDHYRLWFRDQLKPYINELLHDPRAAARPYLNRAGFDELLLAHERGGRNCVNELNKVGTLELVSRLFIDRRYDN